MLPVDLEEEDYSPGDIESPVPAQARSAPVAQTLKVPISLAGLRFDQALAELLPDYSRSRLAAMVKEGAITLDQRTVVPKTKLLGGETIEAKLTAREEECAFRPEDVALNVIHEDDAVIVLDKPAGLVVHPAAGNWSGTLLNGLLYRNPAVSNLPRAGIVHRLDKDTSGVMVAAKTEASQTSLVRQLQARTMKRIYVALVRGKLNKDGVVDAPIGRHPHHRTRMAVVKEYEAGKPAVTHYRVLERFAFHTLVECRLETGRTHQIRVHMQSIGYPLEGDTVYGPTMTGIDDDVRAVIRDFGRQALHARRLSFEHPMEGVERTFEAPIPDDMREFIDFAAGLG
ncbi:MAG: 23S rRNA pseudouridine(1911/1915/1917) synthase RluD [Betaproteobacteria bacterium]|nr:23S rRNA pseudouridine(1911/1915/1917) synthase RluD [Betaproteobacteria bacterium]